MISEDTPSETNTDPNKDRAKLPIQDTHFMESEAYHWISAVYFHFAVPSIFRCGAGCRRTPFNEYNLHPD